MELLDYSGYAERPDPEPPAEGDLSCEVLVVGGGYCGMGAAMRLAERGVDVALAEAEFCGWGASGRNAGHLTPTIVGDPVVLTTAYRRRAPALIGFAQRAVGFAEGLIGELDDDSGYRAVGNVSAALSEGAMRRSERVAEALQTQGAEVELVDGGEFGLPDSMPGGILERDGGTLNPARFAFALRRRLVADERIRVFEGTPVTKIDRRADGFSASARGARIEAEEVLIATNAFSAGLPFAPARAVAPVWVTLAETEPLTDEQLDACGWRSRAGIYTQHLILESYRVSERNTIVFGSRKVVRARPPFGPREPDPGTVRDIERGLRDRFDGEAGSARIERAWGGWIAMTPSWLPVAGLTEDGVHYALGFNGHGLAQAPYLGSLIADRIGGDDPVEDLTTVWRSRPRFLPSPLFSGPALALGHRLDRLGDRIRGG